MDASMINPTRAVRHSLLTMQVVPFIVLEMIGIIQLAANIPTQGMLAWLYRDYGVPPQVYGAFTLICGLLYGLALLRLKSRQIADLVSLSMYGLVSAPLVIYALLAWYWQASFAPGFSLLTPFVWTSLAILLLINHWFVASFSLWLWETQQKEKLKP